VRVYCRWTSGRHGAIRTLRPVSIGTRFALALRDAMHQEVEMSGYAERYQAYWDAIQRRACAVCLDAADYATCGLPRGRTCALPTQLPTIVEAILDVSSDRMDDYVAAIEAPVCARCVRRRLLPDGGPEPGPRASA